MRLLFVGGPLLAAAVAAVLVLELAGGSSGGPGDPADFMSTLYGQIARNDYADAWLTLHPVQQRVASKTAYVTCESQSPIPGKLAALKILGVSDERVSVAGQPGTVAGKAVRVRLSIAQAGSDPVVLVHTGHAVAVGGHWTWILPAERFAEYRAGRCP
jgi:hypothetical protein